MRIIPIRMCGRRLALVGLPIPAAMCGSNWGWLIHGNHRWPIWRRKEGIRVMRHCDHYGEERYPNMHHRKYGDQEVDAVVVGLGAAGGVLLRDLARAGLSVVGIEAGPFWDPAQDFASDELYARTLNWQDTRL